MKYGCKEKETERERKKDREGKRNKEREILFFFSNILRKIFKIFKRLLAKKLLKKMSS